MQVKGDRIFARIYPSREADSRSVMTRRDVQTMQDHFETLKPVYLRKEHDKSPEGVVGEVLDIKFDEINKWAVGNCRVFDHDSLRRIQSGEIDSVSFSFTETSTHLNPMEVSLVSKPYFPGAKILSCYNNSAAKEIIIPATSIHEYLEYTMESQPTDAQTPAQLAQAITEIDPNSVDSPQKSEAVLRHGMTPEQRSRFDALSDVDKAKFVGDTMRDLSQKEQRLSQFEKAESERTRAEAESRIRAQLPLAEKIAARTMDKGVDPKEAQAAKAGLAEYLAAPGNSWVSTLMGGVIEESERANSQLSELQQRIAAMEDYNNRGQAAAQAGIQIPGQQPVVHAYSQQATMKPTANSFDRLFGQFRPSSQLAPSEEQPIQHDYSQGFARDQTGRQPPQPSIPSTAFAARLKLSCISQPLPDHQIGTMDNEEVVHNYSEKMATLIQGSSTKDPQELRREISVVNMTNAVLEQRQIQRGNKRVFDESFANLHPREFDELVLDINSGGSTQSNAAAGMFGLNEWHNMTAMQKRRHPEYAFLDNPAFLQTGVQKVDLEHGKRFSKRQR